MAHRGCLSDIFTIKYFGNKYKDFIMIEKKTLYDSDSGLKNKTLEKESAT